MNFIQGIILTVVFIFILIILQKIFLGREGCTLKSKPICENGTLSCDGDVWKCACDKCNLRYPHIPHPHRCDPTLMPKNCVRATCINGEWKCRDLPISKIQSVLNPLKRVCDDEDKPDCNYPVCINGEWECLKNKEGGCNLSQKIVCVNEDEEPVCINGNWVCGRDILDKKSQYLYSKYKNPLAMRVSQISMGGSELYLMLNDDFSNLGLDFFMLPINGNPQTTGIDNTSGFQILKTDIPYPFKNLDENPSSEYYNFTKFLWNPKINRYPKIGLDLFFLNSVSTKDINPETNIEINLFMFNADTYEIIMYTQLFIGRVGDIMILINAHLNITDSTNLVPMDGYQWNFPNEDAIPTTNNNVPVGLCVRMSAVDQPFDPNNPAGPDNSYLLNDIYGTFDGTPFGTYKMVISR